MNLVTAFCTGCRACEQVCVKNAISMIPDDAGFLTATVDQMKCVNCGICLRTCPQNNAVSYSEQQLVLAAKSQNKELLEKSASGAIFATLAKFILENNGIVYGVKYDDEWNAIHCRISNVEDLTPLLSSKYVQADTRRTFSEVKRDLLDEKKVLYCGTGCQIGGLKAFLKKDFPNLTTIDIVCHGVASPLMFKKYIQWKEKTESGKMSFYDFRSKKNGWGLECEYELNGKRKNAINSIDPYYYSFLKGYSYRECCYKCNYSKPERCGDITICDYWGIEKEHPKFDYSDGASAVLVNTDKGRLLWEKLNFLFVVEKTTFEQVAKCNGNLLRPTTRDNSHRNDFYKGITNDDDWFFHFAEKFKPRLSSRVKAMLPSSVLRILKKMKRSLQ